MLRSYVVSSILAHLRRLTKRFSIRALALGVAFLVLGLEGRSLGRPALLPQQLEQIRSYNVLHFSEPAEVGTQGTPQRHRVVGLFDASPEEVTKVALDFDRYASYMPRVSAQTVTHNPESPVARLTADMPWPVRDLWVEVRFQKETLPEKGQLIRFQMLRGNLVRYEGSLLVEPFGDGRTSVTYELVVQVGQKPHYQGTIGKGAVAFVHCLRSRVNHLMRAGILRAAHAVSQQLRR